MRKSILLAVLSGTTLGSVVLADESVGGGAGTCVGTGVGMSAETNCPLHCTEHALGAKPAGVPLLLHPAFDVSFQDGRSHTSIQRQIARVVADPTQALEGGDPDSAGPIAVCWDAGSTIPPAVAEAVNRAILGSFQSRYQLGGSSWIGTPNTPTALSWSFVPDGLSIPSGVGEPTANSSLFSGMDSKFGGIANRATWILQFQRCFDRWQELTGLSYTRVMSGANPWDDGAAWGSAGNDTTRGDIRISMKPIDGGSNILAYNGFPGNGGDMVLDSADSWGNAGGTGGFNLLRNVVMHEHGHGVGQSHVCPIGSGATSKLMEPFYSSAYDGPRQDDIRGVQYRYGDAYEANNTSATATDMGTLSPSSSTTIGTLTTVGSASLLGLKDADLDFFKVTLVDPKLANITVTAVGSTYNNGPQNGDGSCSAGTSLNALAQGNLVLTVYASNGSTQLFSADVNAAGLNESVSGLLFSNGISYVRVSENGAMGTETQHYTLNVQIQGANIAPSATDGTFTDKVRVTWPAIANATNYQVWRNSVNSISGATQVGVNTLALTLDDTTAVPGTTYFYYLRMEQFGNGSFRYTTTNGNGDSGFRQTIPNNPPTANAGADSTVTDSDNSGSEPVTLNGSLSSDSDGVIVQYRWLEGATVLSTSASSTFNTSFAVGAHTITLEVTDDDAATATDTVLVTVNAGAGGGCDGIDFNGDGVSPDSLDIDDYLSVYGGGPCSNDPNCGDIDFNNDGVSPDSLDIEQFLEVYGGGNC